MTRSGNPFDPDRVYTPIDSISSGKRVANVGDRLRGDQALVEEFGRYFVPDGTPPDEWPVHPDWQQHHAASTARQKDRDARAVRHT